MPDVFRATACALPLLLSACADHGQNAAPVVAEAGSAGLASAGAAGLASAGGSSASGAGGASGSVGLGGDAGGGVSGALGTMGGMSGTGGGVSGTGGGVSGTGGGASGTGGAGAGGSGGFGISGSSLCATAGMPLCEGFENGLDATTWVTTRSGDGTVVVDDMHAARGSKALHVKTSGSGHAYIRQTKTFPIANNNLYGRMFVWFEDDITTSGHFSLAEGAGTGNGALIRFGGQFKEFGVGTDGGSSGDWTDHDTVTVPSKKWLCVEFQFEGSDNMFHVWSDGVARPALDTGANKHNNFVIPQLTSLWFGWWMYNATEPQELWIDEIAVDSKPIGCTK